MKFPYGSSDFYRLHSEGYFYIDRTHLLPVIEETGAQLLFCARGAKERTADARIAADC